MIRPIRQLDNYLISNEGKVFSKTRTVNNVHRRGRWLKPKTVGKYLGVTIGGRNRSLHRLVAETFVDNPKNYPEVNHIDGDRYNNHHSNLEWCTSSHNKQHAYDRGLIVRPKGQHSRFAKYSDGEIELMREIYATKCYTQPMIRDMFGISESHLQLILGGRRNWRQ